MVEREKPWWRTLSGEPQWMRAWDIVLRERPVLGVAVGVIAAAFTAFVTFNRLTVQKLRLDAEAHVAPGH